MEHRQGKIIIHASGGTASQGANTYKLTLPSSWMHQMGIHALDREVELFFDGEVITISRHQPIDEFVTAKCKQGHSVKKLSYFDGDTLCTTIVMDETECVLCIQNHCNNVIKTAFGNNFSPTWEDLQYFLEERCVPRARAGLKEYLEVIGVEAYEPLEIIQKTEGRMAEDDQWIKVEVLR